MKRSKIFVPVALLFAAAIPPAPIHAQMSPSAPVVVRDNSGAASKKAFWLQAEVIHADLRSIVVREQANGLMVHTFTYSPQSQQEMQKVIDAGGYQYGDRVQILCVPGKTVALKIHGKPSKPL